MKKVSAAKVVTAAEASEMPLPPQIREALGELVGAAREGLLALSVGVGLGVVHELMQAEVCEVVGPKGRHNSDRAAKRHGHEDGSMTLGGRRVQVRRPRMRTASDEHETTGARCCASWPTSRAASRRCARRSTRTCATT
jgi:putative transposase